MSSHTLHFGLLLLPFHQWLDAAAPMDYITSHARPFVNIATSDEAVLDNSPNMIWHFISHNLDAIHASSGPVQHPTCTYDSCPNLDYLLVPGPDPTAPLPEGCSAFLQKLMEKETFKGLLTVCTGSIAIAQSGVLDGLRVCSNKMELKRLAETGKLYPKVNWVGDRRWVVDGKVWSAAGITSGLDLAAEFARVHFDPTAVQIVKDLCEYEPLPAQPDSFARLLDGVTLP